MNCFFKALTEKLKQLSENESAVRSQLQDAKDHADLLEFRLLEVEELAKVTTF
jgi:outer membrane murein-binding lipoprotein Lpp